MSEPTQQRRPVLHVVGVAEGEETVEAFVLAHGEDPVRALLHRGWVAEGVRSVDSVSEPSHQLTMLYAVRPASPDERPVEAADPPPPWDSDLVVEPGEEVHVHQRAAAYGLVTSERGLLLTQLSQATAVPGRWNLPGGGIDPGESPVEALHREVWEESGQRVTDVRLLDVHTQHWVGRAPGGRLEDFHAVRIVFAARCPEPTDPVVHDVGGSTADVRWVRPQELGGYPVTRSFAPHLQDWLTR